MTRTPSAVPFPTPTASAPVAASRPTERTFHGHTVVDEYEWLRAKEDPEVLAHLEAENAWTDTRLAHTAALQERIVGEIRRHTAEDDASVPVRLRGWWYFSRIAAGQEYRSHHRAPVETGPDGGAIELTAERVAAATPLPCEQLLVDENALAEGRDFLEVTGRVVSPDDRFVLFGVDERGDERYALRVVEIASGRVVDESVPDAVGGLAWSADGRSFTYLRADDAWRPHQLLRHDVGADATGDTLLVQEDDETYWTDVWGSRDGRWIVVHSASKNVVEVRLLDAADLDAPARVVLPRAAGVDYLVEPAGDHLLVVHDRDSVDYALAWAPLDAPGRWTQILAAEPGGRLLDVVALAGGAVVECRRDGFADVLALPRLDAPGGVAEAGATGVCAEAGPIYGAPRTLVLPGDVRTVVTGPMPDRDATEIRVVLTSLLTPPTTLAWDGADAVRTLHIAPVPGYDAARYVEGRTWATATDGTRVPVTYMHRADVALDGGAPGYLYGYGSYEASVDPAFRAVRLPLLDRGVVMAFAHVRGGGEMGRSWYEQGKELTKRNTFTDFLAAAEHLVAEGFVDGERLVAEGGSAGGLLIGAAINLDPGRFRAVHAAVPFVDALTTMLMPELPLTAGEWEEWGNPIASPEVYEYMASYAPYENIATGAPYPAILATTSLNDTRVFYVEPAKWVARLRERVTNDPVGRPILLRTEMVAGHGGRTGRYAMWADRARELAFLLDQLGLTE